MEGCIKEVDRGPRRRRDWRPQGCRPASAPRSASSTTSVAGYTAAIAIAKALGEKDIVALLNADPQGRDRLPPRSLVAGAKPILKDAQDEEPSKPSKKDSKKKGPKSDEEEDKEPKDAEEKRVRAGERRG